MSQRLDVDQLLRTWLDEDELTPPDAPVWGALERIETTRQRGTLWVSLEERIMRIQPIATVAAVTVMAVIGLAIYLSVAGEPSVGDPSARPTTPPGAIQTQDFNQPMTLVVPDGWALVEQSSSVAITRLAADGVVAEQITVFESTEAEIWGGDGHEPFPADLDAWIADFPAPTAETGFESIQLTLAGNAETSVDGSAASIVDVETNFDPGSSAEESFNLVGTETANFGTDMLLLDGDGRIRFVVIDDRDLVIAYHAPADEYDAEEFDEFVESIRFVGEPNQ